MNLERTTSLGSANSSKSKIALDFLRVDKARFNNDRTPVPLPVAVIERQRKRMVNKRYMACMMARKQATRENEVKQQDNRDAVIKDMKSSASKSLIERKETPLLPWPGFRYHNNGDVRTLSNVQKQRRLLASMKAGQSHTHSTLDVPLLSSAETSDAKARATMRKSRSVDSLRVLIAKRSAGRFSCDNLPGLHAIKSNLSNVGSRTRDLGQGTSVLATTPPTSSPATSLYGGESNLQARTRSATGFPFDRKISATTHNKIGSLTSAATHNKIGSLTSAATHDKIGSLTSAATHDKIGSLTSAATHNKIGSLTSAATHNKIGSLTSAAIHNKIGSLTSAATHNKIGSLGVPSNRSVGSSRLNLNQFGPAVKPVVTSSVWCNADEELMERASFIPKDSFNIRFGVSSKMLHQRKSDLDEHRMMEERRSSENAKNVKKYLDSIKKQIM